mgnify:CR=1 FL=1
MCGVDTMIRSAQWSVVGFLMLGLVVGLSVSRDREHTPGPVLHQSPRVNTIPVQTEQQGLQRTPETMESDLRDSITTADAAYVGNIRTHKFHRSSCHHADCTNCKAKFKTREEAIDAGYEPGGCCHP